MVINYAVNTDFFNLGNNFDIIKSEEKKKDTEESQNSAYEYYNLYSNIGIENFVPLIITKPIVLKYTPFYKDLNILYISLDSDDGAIDLKNTLNSLHNKINTKINNVGNPVKDPIFYNNSEITKIFGSEHRIKIKFTKNDVTHIPIFLPKNTDISIEQRKFSSDSIKVNNIEQIKKIFNKESTIRLTLKIGVWYNKNINMGGFDIRCLQIFVLDNPKWKLDKIRTLPDKLII